MERVRGEQPKDRLAGAFLIAELGAARSRKGKREGRDPQTGDRARAHLLAQGARLGEAELEEPRVRVRRQGLAGVARPLTPLGENSEDVAAAPRSRLTAAVDCAADL